MAGILSYNFVIHALEAAFLASITCGFIGAYIVARRMVFISGGITHASFGGIGLGYFLGINPIFGAAIFSILSAFGIRLVSKPRLCPEPDVVSFWQYSHSYSNRSGFYGNSSCCYSNSFPALLPYHSFYLVRRRICPLAQCTCRNLQLPYADTGGAGNCYQYTGCRYYSRNILSNHTAKHCQPVC